MKKIYLITGVLSLAGCGTVFSGTSQDISFDSNVKEVSVYIDGAFACKTPCVYPAERASGSISIVGKKEGYEDLGMALKTQINPAAEGSFSCFIISAAKTKKQLLRIFSCRPSPASHQRQKPHLPPFPQ